VQEAQQLLFKALTWSVLDGGLSHHLQRACALELAAAHAAACQAAHACAALAAASTAAAKRARLQLGLHTLGPVAVAGLPAWFCEQLRAQEAAAQQLPDDLMGRLALARFCQLAGGAPPGTPVSHVASAVQQAHMLVPSLKTACPKLASECCWASVPLPPPAAPAAVAPGGGLGQHAWTRRSLPQLLQALA
jgi:hypothetical protein